MRLLIAAVLGAVLVSLALADPCQIAAGKRCVNGMPPGKPRCANGSIGRYKLLSSYPMEMSGCFMYSMFCKRQGLGDCNELARAEWTHNVFLILDSAGNVCGRDGCESDVVVTPLGQSCSGVDCGNNGMPAESHFTFSWDR